MFQTKDYPVIRPLLARYRDTVHDIFLNILLERSQDHVTIGQSIYAKVSDMIYCEDLEFASASHLQMTLRGLKNINLYSVPLMMELAEDSLNRCPQLDNFIKTMHQTFPDDNPRPLTRYKRQQPTSFQV